MSAYNVMATITVDHGYKPYNHLQNLMADVASICPESFLNAQGASLEAMLNNGCCLCVGKMSATQQLQT